jgi:hypothetical protein
MSNQTVASNENTQTLTDKAQACLEQAVEVPGAPLYHMGNIAVFNSKSSFELMQSTINYLTCKAKANMPFTNEEKTFLIELYETFWWGGKVKGMPEAGKLADHYVNGKGKTVQMDATPYQQSVVVQDTMKAMKLYIKELASKNGYFFTLKTDDPNFRRSKYFRPLMLINGSRHKGTQGYVFSDGTIFAEDQNQRLKKADHRFKLKADSTKQARDSFFTSWSVENRYDFESFSKGDKFTNLPFSNGKVLLLPDGLSEYMDSGLGIAKPFDYKAIWTEVWK